VATFERLRIFYYVAKEGSIRRACGPLDTTEPRISRNLQELEHELQQRLFIRKKSGLELTPHGLELFAAVQVSINNLEEALENFGKETPDTRSLKIVTTTGVISVILARAVTVFLKEHPDVDIRIYTTNENVNFASSTVDIGILPKINDQPGLSQHKLMTLHSRLFASPEYLKEHGTPKNIQDLSNHQLIGFYPDLPGNRGDADWHLRKGYDGKQHRRARLSMNSVIGQYEAVRGGLGILAIAKEFPFIEEGGLVPILPEEDSINFEIFFIRRAELIPSSLIKQFHDFLKVYLLSLQEEVGK
jgi:DNA-binding transcriptional LysR family regulator